MADDLTSVVAVLSSQMGQLQESLNNALRESRNQFAELGQRISALEEAKIRADERHRLEREQAAEDTGEARHVETIQVARWHVWLGVLMFVVAVAGVAFGAAHVAS